MVLFGKVLLRTRNLALVREFLTAATVILARSVALGTRTIELLVLFGDRILDAHSIRDVRCEIGDWVAGDPLRGLRQRTSRQKPGFMDENI